MPTNVFINLPVKDLAASQAFFVQLGYSFNPQFTDETAACLVISETIYAMLLTHEKFAQFTKKKVVDASTATEVLLALSFDSRAEVDELLAKALKAGGNEHRDPEDHGFMYSRSFEDLDGHIWEVFWMDPAQLV
ncbi:VOC family protein [Patescibacteria group bacterium]|nr:VOC family protein [Patescibacteria group bacterium]